MSKSLVTNLIALSFIALSFILPTPYQEALLFTGLFAFSGAVTNQLAIYMIFDKVPFLYGSGVIEENFEVFKASIKDMIMKQFFNKEQLENFFAKEKATIELKPLVESADFSPAFDALSKTVMESKFGGAINMFGGAEALEELRKPFEKKLKLAVATIVSSDGFKSQLDYHIQHSLLSEDMIVSIETIITHRLDELSPKMVKDLVQTLIKEHLDWLVVWGGVFGGLIGLVSSFLL
jgi:uncharacterized membrane protein YheB (UPF0754 family)